MKQETQNELERFRDYLREQEKSSHTIEKYCRDVRKFLMFADEDWDKNTIISFSAAMNASVRYCRRSRARAYESASFHILQRNRWHRGK